MRLLDALALGIVALAAIAFALAVARVATADDIGAAFWAAAGALALRAALRLSAPPPLAPRRALRVAAAPSKESA